MGLPDPGDFGLVHMGGDAGKLIRLGQYLDGDGFADYEHAFIYVGNGMIVEAEPGGAKYVRIHYNDVLWSTGWLTIPDEQRIKIVNAAIAFQGVPYSAMDYFAIAARRLKLGILVPGLREYVKTTKHMICSQLVDACYQQAGVQLFNDGRWPGYVTPAALASLCGA